MDEIFGSGLHCQGCGFGIQKILTGQIKDCLLWLLVDIVTLLVYRELTVQGDVSCRPVTGLIVISGALGGSILYHAPGNPWSNHDMASYGVKLPGSVLRIFTMANFMYDLHLEPDDSSPQSAHARFNQRLLVESVNRRQMIRFVGQGKILI